ncbi:MAG TPA: recombinase family protein, partial [Ktedonobacterales bacterium]|nr:recombinase family protein [Ktedonobacterales bacterium]
MPAHQPPASHTTRTPHTAWAYIRESKDASASGHSPDTQERLCRALAAEKGLILTHIALEITSGASMSQRPTWKRVQRAALRHEFDALIIWEYARISRNMADWMHFISRALAAGVEVYSTDPQEKTINWHTPVGRAMLAMTGSFNENEREKNPPAHDGERAHARLEGDAAGGRQSSLRLLVGGRRVRDGGDRRKPSTQGAPRARRAGSVQDAGN